ncbi:hypothetical protein DV736_g2928, partial [Chaetothyriales sp. CBS 134916]
MPSKAKRGALPVRPRPPTTMPATVSAAGTAEETANLQLQQASSLNGQATDPTGDTTESAGEPNTAPTVNRKKQKRRAKEALKKAQHQQPRPQDHAPQPNGNSDAASTPSRQSTTALATRGPPKGYFAQQSTTDYASLPPQDYADVASANDHFYSGDEDLDGYAHAGQPHANSSWLSTSKRKKAKKKKASQPRSTAALSHASTAPVRPNFPAVSNAALRSAHRMGDSLWNPSTQAERENIKQFWLGLGEDERRSLVKIEKEAVLRKMKEQQKHSCSCSVCGRKRTAIEEELEVLYDAYYEELEQFANHNPAIVAAPQLVGPPRSVQAHGILTVADDLLKNDGRHFIDMMEQLAERRMAREEEVHFPAGLTHQDAYQGHNHDSMTEEQRMEEGRRMFQIFAARMFEQRVLTAYREKVAAERQAKLLEELEEEDRLDTQREAKKAREAAKKKEKKKAQKLAKEEEKAKKEADKAAQEASAREAEEKKQEEQRLRREEQRKKREAERKAAEDERLRKEAEKHKRIQEQKERQAEAERRQREAKERDKQKKEAAKRKEREEREAREKEARERKAQEAEARRAKEDKARKEREAAAKPDSQPKSQQLPRAQPVALPPGLLPPQRPAQLQSPSFPIASPVVPPKVPTPVRNRQPSHSVQTAHSHLSSPRSQKAATDICSASPASAIVSQSQVQPLPNKAPIQPPMLHHPQPSAPRSPLNNAGRIQYAFNVNGLAGYGVGTPQTSAPGLMSAAVPPQVPLYQGPPVANARYGPNGMHYHPSFGGPRHFPPGQPMPFQSQTAGAPPLQHVPGQPPQPLHSRQASGSTTAETASQPAPIARPPPDQITTALGSKALLDDSDEPIPTVSDRSNLAPLGAPGTARLPFASTFADPKQATFGGPGQGWGGFGGAPGWGAPASQAIGASWPQQPFGSLNSAPQPVHRPHVSRPFAVRILLVQACRQLSSTGETWHPSQAVLHQVNVMKAPNEAPVSMDEMLSLAETEGNAQNGGGSFELTDQGPGVVIKFIEDGAQPRNSVGDIGSPLPHHSQLTPFPSGQSAFGLPGRGI